MTDLKYMRCIKCGAVVTLAKLNKEEQFLGTCFYCGEQFTILEGPEGGGN